MSADKITNWLDILILGIAVLSGIAGNAGLAVAGIALYLTGGVIVKIKGH